MRSESKHARSGTGLRTSLLAGIFSLVLIAGVIPSPVQAVAINLGAADSFAVLGDQGITNTGPTVVSGDIGTHPLTSITGFFGTVENDGPGTFTGTAHQGDALALQAQDDATTAYNTLAGLAATGGTLGMELGGQTLTPDVYKVDITAQLTGILTLDGPGQYVFQVPTALTTASNAKVALINGADACDVWFVAGSAATLGTDTAFSGNIIANTEAITANTRATNNGRLISLGAAVTLDSNVVSVPFCAPAGQSDITVTDDQDHLVPNGGPTTTINGSNFGNVLLLAPSQQAFTITNPGDVDLLLSDFVIDGDFILVGASPSLIITPGSSTDFTVGMDTSTLGLKIGSVSFGTNVPTGNDTLDFAFDLEGNVVLQTGAASIPEPSSMLLSLLAVVGPLTMRRSWRPEHRAIMGRRRRP